MPFKFKQIPVIGPVGTNLAKMVKRAGRKLRNKSARGWDNYVFTRAPLTSDDSAGTAYTLGQITNLLNYAKTSVKGQGAGPSDCPASVSMDIHGTHFKGSRTPGERLDLFPDTWEGKSVLDIGCNHGGNLFHIADRIAAGVGIDYDPPCINAANKIKSVKKTDNISFYTFDLEKEDLDLIRDLIPQDKVDVILLLAVCAWINNGDGVIDFTARIANALLFETNGNEDSQQKQIAALNRNYKNVKLLNEVVVKKSAEFSYVARRLFYCTAPVA